MYANYVASIDLFLSQHLYIVHHVVLVSSATWFIIGLWMKLVDDTVFVQNVSGSRVAMMSHPKDYQLANISFKRQKIMTKMKNR